MEPSAHDYIVRSFLQGPGHETCNCPNVPILCQWSNVCTLCSNIILHTDIRWDNICLTASYIHSHISDKSHINVLTHIFINNYFYISVLGPLPVSWLLEVPSTNGSWSSSIESPPPLICCALVPSASNFTASPLHVTELFRLNALHA